MAIDDIKFTTASIPDVYKSLEIVATSVDEGSIELIVTNYGEEDLTSLGAWISIASNQGDVDNPADYAPHIDYQNLLTWGSKAHRLGVDGGLWIYPPGSATGTRVRRGIGSAKANKINLGNLSAGSNFTVKVKMQVPSWAVARRMFINISVE